MNEYDDLFKPAAPVAKTVSSNSISDPITEHYQDRYKNLWMILLYFVLSVAVVIAQSTILQLTYPNSDDIKSQINVIQEIAFEVEPGSEVGTFIVQIDGTIQNNNTHSIPRYVIEFQFYDSSGKLIRTVTTEKENFEANTTFNLELRDLIFSDEPLTYSYQSGLALSRVSAIIIIFVQSIILSILFFFIDWKYLKTVFQSAIKNWRETVKFTFIGFASLILVLYLSNFFLQMIGVYEVPENELAIQSLFQSNLFVLIVLFLTLCVLTPIIEEIIYRKVLFGFFQSRFGVTGSIILSGVIFGFMHVTGDNLLQIIPYMAMGFVFGFMYVKSKKNLGVVMGMHFLNNFLVFLVYALPLFGELLS